jgi:hypothetical protein
MQACPHEKEQRMKTFAFERWCQLQFSTAMRDFGIHLRSSPPVRRVQRRLLNVCGTYASRKMGVSIQFESHTVELWAIYIMEHGREYSFTCARVNRQKEKKPACLRLL